MKINLRNDSVEIEGYVNAIERNSKPMKSRIGQFIERICKGAFKRAIDRNNDIHILLNHNWDKDLGSTSKGNLELKEDNIGLHARAIITDKEVMEKARNNELVGWSFGFQDRDVDNSIEKGIMTREVKDLDLYEVSILDNTKSPAYEGTLLMARAEGDKIAFKGEDNIVELTINDETEKPAEPQITRTDETTEPIPQQQEADDIKKVIDYSKYEQIIEEMKGAYKE